MAKSRKKIDKNTTKNQKVLVIYVEGETEENYLRYIKSIFNKGLKLEIKRKSKIKDVANFVRIKMDQHSIDDDELVLIYDLEHSVIEYNKFIQNGNLVHKNTYLTQPCIEVTFLMHHSEISLHNNMRITASEAEAKLKQVLPKYKKGYDFNWEENGISKSHIDDSIIKSKNMFQSYQDSLFSTIGEFIEQHIK